jgi:hypothetical protein
VDEQHGLADQLRQRARQHPGLRVGPRHHGHAGLVCQRHVPAGVEPQHKQTWIYEGATYNSSDNQNPADGHPRVFFDESRAFVTGAPIAAGSTLQLKKDSANTAAFYDIDVIDVENPPRRWPSRPTRSPSPAAARCRTTPSPTVRPTVSAPRPEVGSHLRRGARHPRVPRTTQARPGPHRGRRLQFLAGRTVARLLRHALQTAPVKRASPWASVSDGSRPAFPGVVDVEDVGALTGGRRGEDAVEQVGAANHLEWPVGERVRGSDPVPHQ